MTSSRGASGFRSMLRNQRARAGDTFNAMSMKPRTIHGPGLFISQFVGPEPPFNTLGGLAEWAKQLGFKALQIPVADPRPADLAGLPEKDALSKIESVMSKAGLVVSEIAAQRS